MMPTRSSNDDAVIEAAFMTRLLSFCTKTRWHRLTLSCLGGALHMDVGVPLSPALKVTVHVIATVTPPALPRRAWEFGPIFFRV